MLNKLISVSDAVSLVPDGATVAFGGFTMNRHAMAFVYELVRQRKRDLYLFGHSSGGDWDVLIGAGCVKRVEVAYEADGAFNPVGPRWRRAIERGQLEWEDYSNFAMTARFTAGAMGVPFMPIRSLFGSDVLHKEAMTPEQRASDNRTASEKLHVMRSPFMPNEQVVLVPAINPEFAILHVQQCSREGTIRIDGQKFCDVEIALSAKTVIVCAEKIVEEEELRREPERNPLPFFAVQHVCHIPCGAHPYAVYKWYDYDPLQLRLYHECARDDVKFQDYLKHYVFDVKSHDEYLQAVGGSQRLEMIAVDKELGYNPNIKRKVPD